jgi:hypothetical protein
LPGQRLPFDRFLDTERICVSCWSQRDEQVTSQKADRRAKNEIEKVRRNYLKKTGFSAIGLGPLVALTRLPIISQIMGIGYHIFANNRLRLTGRCSGKTCSVK